jgi:hypothetical protein
MKAATLTGMFGALHTPFVLLTLFAANVSARIICSKSFTLEPTVEEIVETVIPIDLTQAEDAIRRANIGPVPTQVIDASLETLQWIRALPIPLRSAVSDGVFEVNLKEYPDLSFKDVYTLHQNYLLMDIFCTTRLGDMLAFLQPWACSCLSGDVLNDSPYMMNEIVKSEGHGQLEISSHNWCVSSSPACTSHSMNQKCMISVDPFRNACVWIRDNELNDTATPLVTYGLSSPTIEEIYGRLPAMPSEYLQALSSPFMEQISFMHPVIDLVGSILDRIVEFIEMMPTRIMYLTAGAMLLYVADDLSSSTIFQYSFVALGGLVLLFFWVCYTLYSVANSMSRNSIPFLAPLAPIFVTSSMMFSTLASLRTMFVNTIADFWCVPCIYCTGWRHAYTLI